MKNGEKKLLEDLFYDVICGSIFSNYKTGSNYYNCNVCLKYTSSHNSICHLNCQIIFHLNCGDQFCWWRDPEDPEKIRNWNGDYHLFSYCVYSSNAIYFVEYYLVLLSIHLITCITVIQVYNARVIYNHNFLERSMKKNTNYKFRRIYSFR